MMEASSASAHVMQGAQESVAGLQEAREDPHNSIGAAGGGDAGGGAPSAPPACYLITYNVSKKHNVGTLARCATAFNVRQVCLIGSRHFNTFGSHGADSYVEFVHYNSLEECCLDLRSNKGCEIVGIEIVDAAKPVQSFPFRGNTAFMLGNEGQGLNEKQLAACDSFCYIAQYGPGTASLNVAVAASIVLHSFAVWAGYPERERQGHKFMVQERPQRTAARGYVPMTDAEAAAERLRRQQLRSGNADEVAVGSEGLQLFD